MRTRSAALLFILFSYCFTVAQSDSDSYLPLNVAVVVLPNTESTCSVGDEFILHMRYDGFKPLRGYVVDLLLTNPTNASSRPSDSNHLPVEAIKIEPNESPIMPGDTWDQIHCDARKAPKGSPLNLTPQVDVLIFDDGSFSGPINLRESSALIGTLEGARLVKQRGSQRNSASSSRLAQPTESRSLDTEPVGEARSVGPLIFTGNVQHTAEADELIIEAKNAGPLPIRGYVYKISFTDAVTGQFIRSVTTKELEKQGYPSLYLAPGATWRSPSRKFSRSQDGSLAGYEVTLDLVVFGNGSSWGPKNSRESDELLGLIRGIDVARDQTAH